MTIALHAVAALLLLSMWPARSEHDLARSAQQTAEPASAQGAPRADPPDGAKTLESRVRTYWALRQQKDLLRMYPFYCAPYRSRVSETDFLRLSRLTRFPLLDVRIVNAAVSGTRAEVTLEIQSEAPEKGIPRFATETTEVWLREPDGTWCKEDEPLPLPSPPLGPSTDAQAAPRFQSVAVAVAGPRRWAAAPRAHVVRGPRQAARNDPAGPRGRKALA